MSTLSPVSNLAGGGQTALGVELAALGTTIALKLWPRPGSEADARAALTRATRWLERAESLLSRFRPGSEVSRLNLAGGEPVRVSRLTFDVVATAVEAAGASGGLFDPTIYRALVAAGYDRSFSELAGVRRLSRTSEPREERGEGSGQHGYAGVRLDRDRLTVQLPRGSGIDLGGIAKGWLADRLARRLRRYGAALADLGGDIALAGAPPGGGTWQIDLDSPLGDGGMLGRVRVSGGGIATSGVTRRAWRTDAGVQHHLIDPRTGLPATNDLLSVTVCGPTAAAAEVAAKCTLLLGLHGGAEAITGTPELSAVLVTAKGETVLAGRVDWWPAGRPERPVSPPLGQLE